MTTIPGSGQSRSAEPLTVARLPSDGSLARLREWASARDLRVQASRTSVNSTVDVRNASAVSPLMSRTGATADEAAFFLINSLSRLGTGPDPWEHA